MNDASKVIKIESSSLVSLKAELARKQKEFQEERSRTQSGAVKPVKSKVKTLKDALGDKNPGVHERATKDAEQRIEEAQQYSDARHQLEKKAQLYDALASGKIQDEGENVLVDFHQKEVEFRNRKEEQREPSQTEEWESTVRLKGNRAGLGTATDTGTSEETSDDHSIHYAHVQNKEIRTHGVGYYQFSEVQTKREEQMKLLEKLRIETVEQKGRKDRFKEKRAKIMEERLAKMRKRRGLPDPPPKVEEKQGTPVEPEPLTRDDAWRKTAEITREWDKGKRELEDYETKLRDERNPDFAPPSMYDDEPANNKPDVPKNNNPYSKSRQKKQPKKSPRKNHPDTFNIGKQLKELRSEVEDREGKKNNLPPVIDLRFIPLPPDPNDDKTNTIFSGCLKEEVPKSQVELGSTSTAFPHTELTDPHIVFQMPDFSVPPPQLPSASIVPAPSTVPLSTANSDKYIMLGPSISDYVPSGNTCEPKEVDNTETEAPQPAHYSSAPQKVQAPATRYERVHLHMVPPTLPAPPTLSNMPKYSAQDGNYIPENRSNKSNKKNVMHMWNQQYKFKDGEHKKDV